jgi:tRNA-2-methylthio-N6-dimethylallyladenosine synthase
VGFDTVYSFSYSPRPGTRALSLPGEPGARVKAERLARLQAEQRERQARRALEWVGREVEVLVEGPSKRDPSRWTGRTPHNRVVNFGGRSAAGRLERVRITESSPFSLRGLLEGETGERFAAGRATAV